MKSAHVFSVVKVGVLLCMGLGLAACADSGSDANQSASSASEVQSPVASVPVAKMVQSPDELPMQNPTQSASQVDHTPLAAVESTAPVREFKPSDFPDACNDYVDEVLQCIKIMDEQRMEGTASMQMQLTEMQGSWLKETNQQQLDATCKMALIDIEPMLHDLGC